MHATADTRALIFGCGVRRRVMRALGCFRRKLGMTIEYTFDVAISFAGSERDYARAIERIASANGLKVFFDELYEADLWGSNLIESLGDIYENKARYCLIIVSKEYCERVYTNLERRKALDRAILHRQDYILPVTTDDAWIEGLPKATAYLDLRKKSVVAVCELLIEKLRGKQMEEKLVLPVDVNVPRMPIGNLDAEELRQYLLDLCSQSERAGIVAFGTIIYDERTVEIRKLLKDQDYWDALDQASGPNLEIFAIRDEVSVRLKGQADPDRLDLITLGTMNRSMPRGIYFSRLLKEYFGEADTLLAYPSFLLFLIENNKVAYCRLIPLSRGSTHECFLQLQKLFFLIAENIEKWKSSGESSASSLWEQMKDNLLEHDYTLYIQSPPEDAKVAVEKLVSYYE